MKKVYIPLILGSLMLASCSGSSTDGEGPSAREVATDYSKTLSTAVDKAHEISDTLEERAQRNEELLK